MQRSTDPGEPNPQEYIYIPAPPSLAQRTLSKRGLKDYKSQNTRNSAVNQSLLETGTMSTSMGMFMWKGKAVRSHP